MQPMEALAAATGDAARRFLAGARRDVAGEVGPAVSIAHLAPDRAEHAMEQTSGGQSPDRAARRGLISPLSSTSLRPCRCGDPGSPRSSHYWKGSAHFAPSRSVFRHRASRRRLDGPRAAQRHRRHATSRPRRGTRPLPAARGHAADRRSRRVLSTGCAAPATRPAGD
jgi:hypothetical protein